MEYNDIREFLSDQEHIQWTHWSKAIAKDFEKIAELMEGHIEPECQHVVRIAKGRLERWAPNWVPYSELDEETKDYDREWADKILDQVPFKCPVHQCGGIMKAVERPFPPGENEDDYPDGRPGDEQLPDLVCTNCRAKYEYRGFESETKKEENKSKNN